MKKRLTSFALVAIGLGVAVAGLTYWNHRSVAAQVQKGGQHDDASAQNTDAGHDEHGAHEQHEKEKAVTLTEEQMKTNKVQIAAAGPGELSAKLTLPGDVRLNADRVAHVVPRIPGVVRTVLKNIGDDVKTGDVMAELDSRELATMKAAYLAAREREALARSTFDREKGLWEKKISAEQDYLSARQALAETAINTRSAEQQLYAVGFSGDYLKGVAGQTHVSYTRYEMTAPFDGTIIEKHIALGESIKEDVSCFTIADLSTVWINLSVYQKDIPAIHKGQEVIVSAGADPSNGVRGTVDYFGPVMGEETRTSIARVVLPNEKGQWRPGQFVTGFVSTQKQPVGILIEKTALQTVEKLPSVFVETEEGFVPTPVTVGRTSDTQAEIVTGLNQGQRYVVSGSFILKAMLEKGELHDEH